MDTVPERLRYTDENCTIKGTLEIVGEKWSLLVLREAFFGMRRFDDFHRALGCARNLLSERLATLVEHGVLERVAYREPGQRTPPRVPPDREGARPGADARRADGTGATAGPRTPTARPSRSATAAAAARCARCSPASTGHGSPRAARSRRCPVRARAALPPPSAAARRKRAGQPERREHRLALPPECGGASQRLAGRGTACESPRSARLMTCSLLIPALRPASSPVLLRPEVHHRCFR